MRQSGRHGRASHQPESRSEALEGLARNARGATAIEYCLLLAMLAMAMPTVLDNLGFTLAGVFDTTSNAIRGI